MLRVEDRQIGEHTYRVRQLPFGKARPLLPVLLRSLGPSVGSLLDREGVSGLLETEINLSKAITEFSYSLKEQDLDTLTDALAEQSFLVGAEALGVAASGRGSDAGCARIPDIADEWWPPRYHEFAGWLAFAVEVNFGSFLGGKLNVGAVLSGVRGAASASTSPKGSTGTSGESSLATG